MKMSLCPNHTQIPDVYLDVLMRELSPAQFKVLMAISRFTFGWQKKVDEISLQQLRDYTGLGSDHTILDAIAVLKEKQVIFVESGNWLEKKSNIYQINLSWTPDLSLHSVQRDSLHSVQRRTKSLAAMSAVSKDIRSYIDIKTMQPAGLDASNEAPRKGKDLDPKVRYWADQIYATDRQKFRRLVVWLRTAEKENYAPHVVATSLEQFFPYAGEVRDWWPFLTKMLNKAEGQLNARDSEAQHARRKKEERDWIAAGGIMSIGEIFQSQARAAPKGQNS